MSTHPRARFCRASAFLWLICTVVRAFASEDERGFVDRVYRDDTGEHKYVVFVPHTYTPEKQWPVLLFLHGAGERGTDGKLQAEVGLGRAVRARAETFPFIAVFPQCEDRDVPAIRGWLPETSDGKRALAILAEVEKTYRTDKDRVCLTGLSMGGFGAWAHAAANPDRWAAVVPICGGGDPSWAAKIAPLPIWCFHGADDRVIRPQESQRMIESLKKAGASPKYTEYPGIGHNSWDAAYGSDELYTWLLTQKRGANTSSVGSQKTETHNAPRSTLHEPEAPFNAALEIPHAVFVRLGNEMLASLADSLPHVISADALSGKMADVQQTTSTEGMTFNIQLRGISYRGRVTRAVLESRANDRIAVTLIVRDVNLVINRTYLSGEGRSATAGPIRIVLGNRTDLPIGFEVQPYVEGRRLRLKLLGTRFRLPRDNWYVGYPEWVTASGLGMTESRVGNGLRDGLYNDPGRIEREVVAAVPRMLEQIENRLSLEPVSAIVAGLWPLPVYKPRLRVWPSDVRTDDSGATVGLGISVAAFDEKAARERPKIVELSGSDILNSLAGEQFRFGIAPELMGPLSLQVIADEAARVHVADVPMRQLAQLSDARVMAEIVPDLKQRGDQEVRAELMLASPLHMNRSTGDSSDAILFDVPKARCLVAVHPKPDSPEWVPYLEIDFHLRQAAKPKIVSTTPSARALALVWQGQATIEVEARFAVGYSPSDEKIDINRIREIFAAGWRDWTESGPLAKVALDDLDLGFSKLRADHVGWDGAYLSTTFGPAGLVIKNLVDQPVAYEIKGPYSEWGGPYTLEPRQDHRYPIAYPVTCRFRVKQQDKVYTLPAGSRFEFQAAEDGDLDLYVSREDPISETQTTSLETKDK